MAVGVVVGVVVGISVGECVEVEFIKTAPGVLVVRSVDFNCSERIMT